MNIIRHLPCTRCHGLRTVTERVKMDGTIDYTVPTPCPVCLGRGVITERLTVNSLEDLQNANILP